MRTNGILLQFLLKIRWKVLILLGIVQKLCIFGSVKVPIPSLQNAENTSLWSFANS